MSGWPCAERVVGIHSRPPLFVFWGANHIFMPTKCPFCAEQIAEGMNKCPHCDSTLTSHPVVLQQAPVTQLPLRVVKSYTNNDSGRNQRATAEATLFAQGYRILQEEQVKEFDNGKACCLAIIFLPLVFLSYNYKIRVTYELR